MPMWFFALQVVLMLAGVWLAYKWGILVFFWRAMGGSLGLDGAFMVCVILGIVAAEVFLVYNPTFLWEYARLFPLPPSVPLR